MTGIKVYDLDAKRIEAISEDYGVIEAEVVEALLDILEDEGIAISEWL